ncbi:PEGA domain protein [Spirochaeta thermophila DSM 6578]|uniref:PEGA domain protein n=2 Tax=Winmispira thermophila TaxID=154 RepID=G0GCG6_WINT7|nr:PEGA domain protein [Spirochaeta thermophila DSM 6578]
MRRGLLLLFVWMVGHLWASDVRISIFPFQSDYRLSKVAKAATSFVETAFIKESRFDVITRRDMEAVLSQQELSLSDVTDPSSAIRLGKVLTAQYVVIGELQAIGDVVLLAARMLDVETGRMVAAETGTARTLSDLESACTLLARSLAAQFFKEALPGSDTAEGKSLLFITSVPTGARVYINGKYAGETPFRVEQAERHTYRVKIEMDEYVPYETIVRVHEPRIYRVEASLVRDEAGLVIDADVGADVFVDERFMGSAPVEVRVTSGTHRVRVEREGYHAETKKVEVQPGQTLNLSFRLKEKRPLFAGLERERAIGVSSGWGTSTVTLASAVDGGGVALLPPEEGRTGWWGSLSFYFPSSFFSIDAELAAERMVGYGSRLDLVMGIGSPADGPDFSLSAAWLVTVLFPRGFENMEEQIPVVWPWGMELGMFIPLSRNFLFRFSANTFDFDYLEAWGLKLMMGVVL